MAAVQGHLPTIHKVLYSKPWDLNFKHKCSRRTASHKQQRATSMTERCEAEEVCIDAVMQSSPTTAHKAARRLYYTRASQETYGIGLYPSLERYTISQLCTASKTQWHPASLTVVWSSGQLINAAASCISWKICTSQLDS